MRMWVWSLALLGGLRIQHCHELWCRLLTWLGSCVAVAVAAALIKPLGWEPPCATGAALKRPKKKKKVLFWKNYWFTGSCKESTEGSCIPFIQFPPNGYTLLNCNTISKPGNWPWYSVCLSSLLFYHLQIPAATTIMNRTAPSPQRPPWGYPFRVIPTSLLFTISNLQQPSIFHLYNFVILRTFYTWNQQYVTFWDCFFFTHHNARESYPSCCVYQESFWSSCCGSVVNESD